MKKIYVLLAGLAFLCFASACAKNKKPQINVAEELAKPFESTVAVRYKEIDATLKIAKRAPGYCKLSFESPQSLKDMTVEFTVDAVNIDYKALHTSFKPSSISGSALSKLLITAIDSAAMEEGVHIEYNDDIMLISGRLSGDGSEFTMRIDPNNGNIIRLSVPQDDFEAEFSNFSFIAA